MPCIVCSKNYVCDKCKYIGEPVNCNDELKDLKVFETVFPSISGSMDDCEKEAIVIASTVMQGRSGNIYCMLNAGMGCNWIVRRNTTNRFEAFFMHGDNWSQYGPSTDDTSKLKKFLEGYVQF